MLNLFKKRVKLFTKVNRYGPVRENDEAMLAYLKRLAKWQRIQKRKTLNLLKNKECHVCGRADAEEYEEKLTTFIDKTTKTTWICLSCLVDALRKEIQVWRFNQSYQQGISTGQQGISTGSYKISTGSYNVGQQQQGLYQQGPYNGAQEPINAAQAAQEPINAAQAAQEPINAAQKAR
jgi:hypothetical protein